MVSPLFPVQDYFPPELSRWLSEFDDLAIAWNACHSAPWLLHMALSVQMDRGLIVHAAADLAADALVGAPILDLRANAALSAALAWISGRGEAVAAQQAGESAIDAAATTGDDNHGQITRAAAHVALACDDELSWQNYAAVAHPATAAAFAQGVINQKSGQDGAKFASERAPGRVRARIPLSIFLAAHRRASERPPPFDRQQLLGSADGRIYLFD